RAGRAMEKLVGTARDGLLEACSVADLVHEPEPQRFRRHDALAREPIAAEGAMPHGANEERHHAEWRHADANLWYREERRVGRDRDVAAGDKAGTAADRTAMRDRYRRLRQS